MLQEFKEFISRGNLIDLAVAVVFLNAVIAFVTVAFVLFLVVKAYNRAFPKKAAPTGPTEVELLTEIRDELRRR